MSKNVEQSILSKAIIHGRTHYYKYEDALELVGICQQCNSTILGIDAFVITETKTQPFMEHSIDFSSALKHENSFKLV